MSELSTTYTLLTWFYTSTQQFSSEMSSLHLMHKSTIIKAFPLCTQTYKHRSFQSSNCIVGVFLSFISLILLPCFYFFHSFMFWSYCSILHLSGDTSVMKNNVKTVSVKEMTAGNNTSVFTIQLLQYLSFPYWDRNPLYMFVGLLWYK